MSNKLKLRLLNAEDAKEEYLLFQETPSENGYVNEAQGMDFQAFKREFIPTREKNRLGIDLKPGYVPDAYYILWDNDKAVALFKIRPCMNDFLRNGPGNIGYAVRKNYRGKGYATRGLKLALDILFSDPKFQENEAFFETDINNIFSQKVILNNGGYVHHIFENKVYLRVPKNRKAISSIPLSEYDSDTRNFFWDKQNKPYPSKLVIAYFGEAIDKLLATGEIELFDVVKGETNLSVYRFKNTDILLVKGIVGEPAMGGFTDLFIHFGVNKIVFIGGGGALVPLSLGEIVLVESAVRDEGFSFHYLPPSRYVYADKEVLNKAEEFLRASNISYRLGRAWTTDAMYRETEKKIKVRKEEGALVVEMEQAGLLALTRFRKVSYVGLIYAGDDLSGEKYDTRQWNGSHNFRYDYLLLAKALVQTL